MAFPMINAGFGFNTNSYSGGWGNNFANSCNRILGPNKGGLLGGLAGGLIGTILGGGNPFMGLIGGSIGALLGQSVGRHNHGNYGNHHHPHHQQCASYPPCHGHHFGGPQFGGYQQPMNCGQSPFGQPHWGGQGNNMNMNFNFGHQCPPSNCCHPPQHNHCHGQQQGQLKQDGKGKPISYTTSGGYQVSVDKHTITIKDPSGKNTVQHWGDPHEKLNGKHIKDWQGKDRTVVLGDGTKITMGADGPKGVTLNTSIYDGRQNIQIDNKKNEISHHSFNPFDTMFREMSQHDGETALFYTNHNGAGVYNNIYQEDKNFNISPLYQQLGRTGGYSNPSKVYDFYDDPTLKHT